MSERQPTIEQKSHFSTKTQQCQDVEFVATLRFFISPSGDVKISTPNDTTQRASKTDVTHQADTKVDKKSEIDCPPKVITTQEECEKSEITRTQTKVNEEKISTETCDKELNKKEIFDSSKSIEHSKSKTEVFESNKNKERDIPTDHGFPRGPPSDCPIAQFIPDPCRAIDDLQKSIKSLWKDYFSHKCPPKNSGNTSERSYPKVADDELNSKMNKSDSEIIKNEEKFEV